MSVRIMSMVFESRGPESTEKLVLLALADHANDDGLSIYPSVERVANKTALSERTVQLTIKKLVEETHLLQLVRAGGGRYTTNEYRILVKNLQSLISVRGEADSPLFNGRGESGAVKGESASQKGESGALKGEVDSPESSLTIIESPENLRVAPSFSSFETASAIASFGNNGARACEQLYQQVTGQVCIPPNQTDMALKYLQAILDSGEPDIEQGKRVFAQWCSTTSKTTGRNYSKLTTAWLGKWLEQLAPVPEATHGIGQQTDLERAMARIHAAAQER